MKRGNKLLLRMAVLFLAVAVFACGKGEEKGETTAAPVAGTGGQAGNQSLPVTGEASLGGSGEPGAAETSAAEKDVVAAPVVAPPPPAPNMETDLPGSPPRENASPPPAVDSGLKVVGGAPTQGSGGKEVLTPKVKVVEGETGVESLETPPREIKSSELDGPRRSALPAQSEMKRRSDRLKMALPR